MASVLVINSGSSSFKYQLIDADSEQRLASGLVERIGETTGHATHDTSDGHWERSLGIPDHTAGFGVMIDAFAEHGPSLEEHPPVAVGHRVVHGGARFFEPTLITPLVLINIEDLSELAPLHNPANVEGIRAAQAAFPDLPHVAVFDTAFHQTMPADAYTYGLEASLAERLRIRRYGFHGTSHEFVSRAAADFVGRPLAELKQIVLHLGNGASVCAVDGGRSVDTSMGFTPLEGLVMGTRTGDIDPAVLLYLQRKTRIGVDDLDDLLNKKSGILGLSGHRDMRDLTRAAASGDETSRLALGVYVRRVKRYVGAYLAELGGADLIVFTAGIGENSSVVRERSLAGMQSLGIEIDSNRNAMPNDGPRIISTDASVVTVLVVPTNEELEIARQTLRVAE
ncbi:acetate/propionate family kinase [Humibacter albus]|jgi:acetate kinase|uniref:acetate/propionate family kinase n=1 Tax=Humibacter albus TaxID=427754 RepID=UPI0003B6696D|nr:acetate kinase [Humibacter albus]